MNRYKKTIMRTAVQSFIGIILVFFGACGPASAMMCDEINKEDGWFMALKKLYEYAQIAEAPKHRDLDYMAKCKDNSTIVVDEKSMGVTDIGFDKDLPKLVRMMHAEGDGLVVHPTETNDDGQIFELTVGCRDENGLGNTFTGVRLKQFVGISDLRVSFHLAGTGVTGMVDNSGSVESMAVIPGTDLSKIEEIFTNFNGEKCVFPLVHTTVRILCGILSDGEGQSRYLTMIGHSLGGLATQYVALNVPTECNLNDNSNAFAAYAFASPGLMNQRAYIPGGIPIVSFLVDDDFLLKGLFRERFQLNRIVVFSPQNWHVSDSLHARHSIDEVQAGICSCLRGEGVIHYCTGGQMNQDIFNKNPCESDTLPSFP